MAGKLKSACCTTGGSPRKNLGIEWQGAPRPHARQERSGEEVVETLTKLDHEPILHVLDGTVKSLHAAARIDCDLIFNLTESFGGNDTADFNIAAYLELIGKRFTGTGSHGLMLAQDKTVAKKIFAFHGIHTPVFARSFRGRLAFSHDLHFPVIVKPAREDGSIGIEFNAVVSSIKELMERIDGARAVQFAGAH